jgi:hypothetical protein
MYINAPGGVMTGIQYMNKLTILIKNIHIMCEFKTKFYKNKY